MALTEWTYPLGDGKAVAGHELTSIASQAHESTTRTSIDSRLSPSALKFEPLQKDIDDFNNRIAAWGDYWHATFDTCETVIKENGESYLTLSSSQSRAFPNTSGLSLERLHPSVLQLSISTSNDRLGKQTYAT
jgi:hypothetical protein